MIDLHNVVAASVAPVRVRPAEAYVPVCTVMTDVEVVEVSDTEAIIVPSGNGTGVIDNPRHSLLTLFHLGRALTLGPRKINNLPSACDLMIFNDYELIVAELTESNPRSMIGVPGAPKPGKMEKAKRQLKSTIFVIETVGYNINPQKKTAICFFRLRTPVNGAAAKSLNAFRMMPTLRMVTYYTDNDCPDWEFRNHPYPHSYTIQ